MRTVASVCDETTAWAHACRTKLNAPLLFRTSDTGRQSRGWNGTDVLVTDRRQPAGAAQPQTEHDSRECDGRDMKTNLLPILALKLSLYATNVPTNVATYSVPGRDA